MKSLLDSPTAMDTLKGLYGLRDHALVYQADRYARLTGKFTKAFGADTPVRYFSAPGRVEVIGNHTDHNNGRVVAAAVTIDTIAAVTANDSNAARVLSEYDGKTISIEIPLNDVAKRDNEHFSATSIVRGAIAYMKELGANVTGFSAVVQSDVKGGSGLSSSAAFEVLMLTILNEMFMTERVSQEKIATLAQRVENEYFGKPSGLMDQMASAVGGLVAIDFKSPDAVITPIKQTFSKWEHSIVIVNTAGSHAGLSHLYSTIPTEMKEVAAFFGEPTLRKLRLEQVETSIAALRQKVSDRAIMRAFHFFDEDERAANAAIALNEGNFDAFLTMIRASGDSSWRLLQNVTTGADSQPLALALELAGRILGNGGAYRINGGGFAGTILCIVPDAKLDAFNARMSAVFGERSCQVLGVRRVGSCEVLLGV